MTAIVGHLLPLSPFCVCVCGCVWRRSLRPPPFPPSPWFPSGRGGMGWQLSVCPSVVWVCHATASRRQGGEADGGKVCFACVRACVRAASHASPARILCRCVCVCVSRPPARLPLAITHARTHALPPQSSKTALPSKLSFVALATSPSCPSHSKHYWFSVVPSFPSPPPPLLLIPATPQAHPSYTTPTYHRFAEEIQSPRSSFVAVSGSHRPSTELRSKAVLERPHPFPVLTSFTPTLIRALPPWTAQHQASSHQHQRH